MGYRRKPKTYKIIWDEGDLAGLEVRLRELSLGQMLELSSGVSKGISEANEGLNDIFTLLVNSIIEWNLEEEDGTPVRPSVQAIHNQNMSLVMEILVKWMSAMSDVDTPLPGTSNSGGTSDPARLQLAAASNSLAS